MKVKCVKIAICWMLKYGLLSYTIAVCDCMPLDYNIMFNEAFDYALFL